MRNVAIVAVAGLMCMTGLAIAEPEAELDTGEQKGPPHMANGDIGEHAGQGGESMRSRGGRDGQPPKGGLLERLLNNPKLAEEIGLTDEQVTSLRKTMDELRKKEIDLSGELEKSGIDQARLMADENAGEKSILEVIEKTGRVRTELAKVRAQRLFAVRNTLNEEQRKKLHERMRSRMEARKGKGEEGGGRGMRKGGGEGQNGEGQNKDSD